MLDERTQYILVRGLLFLFDDLHAQSNALVANGDIVRAFDHLLHFVSILPAPAALFSHPFFLADRMGGDAVGRLRRAVLTAR